MSTFAGAPPGWRIALKDQQLRVQAGEDDGIFEFDEENNLVVFKIRLDA
ncbi:hypothetical protein ACVWWJ_000404 [Luteibacter sp. HA06]